MTTANEIRKTQKTQQVKINPTAKLTDHEGSFLFGVLLARRDVPYEGKSFKVYDFKIESGDFLATEGKEETKVNWKAGDIVQLKGTARINWALSNLADGSKVLIEYLGTKKSKVKGKNDAHDFAVEVVMS